MFAERKINPQWSMSVNPGYQQVGYGSQSSIASWVTGQFEMPVKLHYAAPSMKNGRLNVGFNQVIVNPGESPLITTSNAPLLVF